MSRPFGAHRAVAFLGILGRHQEIQLDYLALRSL